MLRFAHEMLISGPAFIPDEVILTILTFLSCSPLYGMTCFFNALLFLSFTERPTYLNSSAALKLFLPYLSWISTEITFRFMRPPTSNEYSKFMSHLRKWGTMFEGHHFHFLRGRIRHTQPSTFRGQLEPVSVIVFYNWEPLMTSVKLLRNSRSETHVEGPLPWLNTGNQW